MRRRGKLAAFVRGYSAPRKTEVRRQMSDVNADERLAAFVELESGISDLS
jgi:hypothetical protein